MRAKVRIRKDSMFPQRMIVGAFACAIFIGTILLALPFSNADGRWHFNENSLFLATSATCVTGLDPVGIGESLTVFGLFVMILLVELGGIGIMTVGTFFFIIMGRRLSISEERVIMNTLGEGTVDNVSRIIRSTLRFTFTWEIIGATMIAWRLHQAYGYTLEKAILHGIFMSIMSFCNAGFTVDSDSLCRFADDPFILVPLLGLMLMGGIGFIVHANLTGLWSWKTFRVVGKRLSLHSQIVLKTTGIIMVTGTIAILLLEWSGCFAEFSIQDKIFGAFFQTATSRTTGFAAVPTTALRNASLIITMALMFVGAAPGSTGGGIKVTTAAVLYATVRDIVRKKQSTEIHLRSIPNRVVTDAISITVLSVAVVTTAFLILSVTEETTGVSMFPLFFEIVSAYTTTGLSLNVTATLTLAGKLLIIMCMFIGRLGPMTLAVTMSRHQSGPAKRYPEENVIVG